MTLSAFFQQTADSARDVAQNGLVAGNIGPGGMGTVINSLPQARQVGRIVVDTQANDTAYTWTLNGEVQTITSDASGTKQEIADAIAQEINEDPVTGAWVYASSDGVDTVTITGKQPGEAFTLSDSDANLTSTAADSADSADAVPFGRAVIQTSYSADGDPLGGLPLEGQLAAQVITLALTYQAGEEYSVGIKFADQWYDVENVAADTDTATTATALRAAINALMPANTVVCTGSTGSIILTSEIEGAPFEVRIGLKSGTASRLTITNTTVTANTNLAGIFAGISALAYDEIINDSTDAPEYPANAGVRVCKRGEIWVQNTQSPSLNDAVYVETAAGSTCGRLYTTGSATRVKLPRELAKWKRYDTNTGLALVSVAVQSY